MPNIVNLFPLSVYHDTITLDAGLKERLVQVVLDMGAQPAMKQSPGAAWTGDVNGHEFLHEDERFRPLFVEFGRHLHKYLEFLAINEDSVSLYYTRAWATISRGNEKIFPHSHRQSHISLAYYLKKPPGSGNIAFTDNEPANEFAPELFRDHMIRFGIVKQSQQFNAMTCEFHSNENDVLIFPSKTVHGTTPNQSGEPRISIAVDINFTAKDTTGMEHMLPDLEHWQAVG